MKFAFHFTLIALLVLAARPSFAKDVEASAGGDICDVRPDLCGGAPLPKKKKVKRQVHQRAGTVTDSSGRKKAKCREKGASWGLDDGDLPICGSEAAKAAEEVEGDLAELEYERKVNPNRRPASRPAAHRRGPASLKPGAGGIEPLVVTFETYLHSNAAHPAIARRPASMATNQKAFIQPVVRATITGSTLDQPQGEGPRSTSPPPPGSTYGGAGHNFGNAQPASDGINPGDAPTSGADSSQGSPLR